MKAILVGIATLAAAPVLFGQQPVSTLPLISTSGSAEIRVVPDLADLFFEVEIRNVDLELARKQQAERSGKVLAVLRAAGVSDNELHSSQIQIAPNYGDYRDETSKVRFYRVAQDISCTLHQVKDVESVTADAVAAGATGVRDTTLRTSQLRQYRDEARAKAIRAAKEKATALASELGVKVGKPQAITEGSDLNQIPGNSNIIRFQTPGDEQAGESGSSAFAPGTITISATVSVSFLLE